MFCTTYWWWIGGWLIIVYPHYIICHLSFWSKPPMCSGSSPLEKHSLFGQTSCSTCCHGPKYSSSCAKDIHDQTHKLSQRRAVKTKYSYVCGVSENLVQENWCFIVVYHHVPHLTSTVFHVPCTSMIIHIQHFQPQPQATARSWACSRKPGGTGAVCMAWRSMRSMLLYSCPNSGSPFLVTAAEQAFRRLGICLKTDVKKKEEKEEWW